MKVFLMIAVAVFLTTGCGKQQEKAVNNIPVERQEMAKKLIIKSLLDLQNKDLASSVASLEASIKINPTSPDAYLLLGQILLKVEEYKRAAEFLDDAVKLFPQNGMMYYMLAMSNRMDGKKLPAVLAARRSVELFQDAQDKDNMLKSAVLLQDLINTPDDKYAPANTDSK